MAIGPETFHKEVEKRMKHLGKYEIEGHKVEIKRGKKTAEYHWMWDVVVDGKKWKSIESEGEEDVRRTVANEIENQG